MEGLFRRNDNGLGNTPVTGVTAGTLDGSLVGFGTGVTEKGFVPNRVGTQPVGEGRLRWNEIEIGTVVKLGHLFANGSIQGIVVVTQGASGNS